MRPSVLRASTLSALTVVLLAMLLSGAESLRDVIPFPKTQKGTDLMTDSPAAVDPKQLRELYLELRLPTKV